MTCLHPLPIERDTLTPLERRVGLLFRRAKLDTFAIANQVFGNDARRMEPVIYAALARYLEYTRGRK